MLKKTLIIILSFFIFFAFVLNAYLSPDDLAVCHNKVGYKQMPYCKKADAIIVISGGDTKSRVIEGVALFKGGWADRIILSGAAADKNSQSNAQEMRQIAISHGVDVDSILLENNAKNTKENADRTYEIVNGNNMNINRVILVTSPYHQRRASIDFKKKFTGIEILNHPTRNDNLWSDFWWFTIHGWYLALSELFKIVLVYLGVEGV